jgi:hypothetical protein
MSERDNVVGHPAARLPAAYDENGQGWLPPVAVAGAAYQRSWAWRHEPEYLVAIGRAKSIGVAHMMLVRLLMARHASYVLPGDLMVGAGANA